MKSFLTALCTVYGSFLLIIAILIMSIEMFALNTGFFDSEYEKLDTAQTIGMSKEDLSTVTKNLLNYTTGERDSLDMKAVINSSLREVFDQREKAHMVDVRALYLNARNVRTVCFAGAAVLFIIAFILSRRKALQLLCSSFLRVSAVFVVMVAAIGIYAAIDFTNFWITFHHIFFTNSLWQLYPNEVLIMMVPEQFFSDLVMRIIIRFVSIFLTLNVAAFVGVLLTRKHAKRLEAKEA